MSHNIFDLWAHQVAAQAQKKGPRNVDTAVPVPVTPHPPSLKANAPTLRAGIEDTKEENLKKYLQPPNSS